MKIFGGWFSSFLPDNKWWPNTHYGTAFTV